MKSATGTMKTKGRTDTPKGLREMVQLCSRRAVAFVSVCIVILIIGYKIGPESAWPVALLQYIPHIFLFLALASVALSLALGPRWWLVSITCLVAFVTIVMGLELNVGGPDPRRTRLMTYNVKSYLAVNGPVGMWPIKFEIDLHDAEIIVLQDAGSLIALLAATPNVAHLLFGNRNLYTYGQYVVASRYPLRLCGSGSISYRDKPHTYVRCVIDVNGLEVDLFTAHFLTPRDGLNAIRLERLRGISEWKQNIADRMLQAKSLAQDLNASSRPIIVAGDLNAPEHSLVVRTLLGTGLRDAFSAAGSGFGYTYGHALWPGISFMRIDHILVGPQIGIADCFVGSEQGSTHRAVIADLIIGSRQ